MLAVTGANGFIGKSLLKQLAYYSYEVKAIGRRFEGIENNKNVQRIVCVDLDKETNFVGHLKGVSVLIHAAARVHVMHDLSDNPLSEFRSVNVQGTLNLARQAAKAKVKRFIFISSIKVNGENTNSGKYFTADDSAGAQDPYGLSKAEAEKELRALSHETGMEVVIIRPTVVYGPGVKGNIASIIKLLRIGIPLPLGAVHNKRSMIGIDNLIDLIIKCIDHPAASNETFLASDGYDMSTTEILVRLSKAMDGRTFLVPISPALLIFFASMLGKRDIAQRLFCSLQVDISKTRSVLDWDPPISIDEGFKSMLDLSTK
jgi:nucleoside-diphosphate-sugar epimerase